MAHRIPPEKKAKAVRLFLCGASFNQIAARLGIAKSTVRCIVERDPRCVARSLTVGCQDQGPSLAEIEARRDAIRDGWPDDERERRAASAYRRLPAVLECSFGGKHWNGEAMA